jgi:hypothetical protein
MRADAAERCRRCGTDAFHAGTPFTIWVWLRTEEGSDAQPLHLCHPCGRDFESTSERGEYLRLVAFG